MEQNIPEDDELDLLQLAGTVFRRRKMIIITTVAAMVLVVAFSAGSLILPPEVSYLPNEYTPRANMMINDASSSGGGLSSMLSSSGLGGLASLAGVSVPSGSTYSSLAVYLTAANPFLDSVIDKFDLVTRYKIKKFKRADTRLALKEKLSVSFDEDSAVLSVAFTDIDPVFAQSVVNYCVDYLEKTFTEMGLDKNKLQKVNLEKNIEATYGEIQRLQTESKKLEYSASYGTSAAGIPSVMLESSRLKLELDAQQMVYTQLKTQYELLKVTMASETPIFQVLEYAEVPDKKSGPSRGMICAIVTFAAFFCAVIAVFVLDAVKRIKGDPVAMGKLKGEEEPQI
jgi:uncharacterized protein involved in exopolysaccharide biosynthesis